MNSATLANQVLSYMQTNPHGIFAKFNGPQLTAIAAALTRRLTMVQGPPGTGKVCAPVFESICSPLHFSLAHAIFLTPFTDHSCGCNSIWLCPPVSLDCTTQRQSLGVRL